jgi:hypothetical protein
VEKNYLSDQELQQQLPEKRGLGTHFRGQRLSSFSYCFISSCSCPFTFLSFSLFEVLLLLVESLQKWSRVNGFGNSAHNVISYHFTLHRFTSPDITSYHITPHHTSHHTHHTSHRITTPHH